MRENSLFHPDHEDGAKLETLCVMQGHQRDLPAVVLAVPQRVLVRVERDLLQEAAQRRLLSRAVVLARDADELLEILDAAARLDRPLGLERLQVAAAIEDRLD